MTQFVRASRFEMEKIKEFVLQSLVVESNELKFVLHCLNLRKTFVISIWPYGLEHEVSCFGWMVSSSIKTMVGSTADGDLFAKGFHMYGIKGLKYPKGVELSVERELLWMSLYNGMARQ